MADTGTETVTELDGVIKTVNEINTLYDNAQYYLTIGEAEGSIVSYASCASMIRTILNNIDKLVSDNETTQPSQESPPTSPVSSQESQELQLSPTISVSQEQTPSASSADEKCAAIAKEIIKEKSNLKEKLEQMLLICLGNVETLQSTIRSKNASVKDDEEVNSLEERCANLKPIDLSEDALFFKDVIGLEEQKKDLIKSFVKPLLYPNLYPKLGKGFLYYGFPGTGKTFLAKAAVNELAKEGGDKIGVLFLAPTGAELKGKYVGETEKNIKKVWECASHMARECERKFNEKNENMGKCKKFISILFLDEFDSIAKSRDNDPTGLAANAVNTILQMMDGIESPDNVAVMAATNYPWNLDTAILRRFNKQQFLDLPNENDIEKLLQLTIRKNAKITPYKPPLKAYPPDEDKGESKTEEDHCFKIADSAEKAKPLEIDNYFEIQALQSDNLTYLKSKYVKDHYSNSDISKVCIDAFSRAGDDSLENGLFFKLEDNDFESNTGLNELKEFLFPDNKYAKEKGNDKYFDDCLPDDREQKSVYISCMNKPKSALDGIINKNKNKYYADLKTKTNEVEDFINFINSETNFKLVDYNVQNDDLISYDEKQYINEKLIPFLNPGVPHASDIDYIEKVYIKRDDVDELTKSDVTNTSKGYSILLRSFKISSRFTYLECVEKLIGYYEGKSDPLDSELKEGLTEVIKQRYCTNSEEQMTFKLIEDELNDKGYFKNKEENIIIEQDGNTQNFELKDPTSRNQVVLQPVEGEVLQSPSGSTSSLPLRTESERSNAPESLSLSPEPKPVVTYSGDKDSGPVKHCFVESDYFIIKDLFGKIDGEEVPVHRVVEYIKIDIENKKIKHNIVEIIRDNRAQSYDGVDYTEFFTNDVKFLLENFKKLNTDGGAPDDIKSKEITIKEFFEKDPLTDDEKNVLCEKNQETKETTATIGKEFYLYFSIENYKLFDKNKNIFCPSPILSKLTHLKNMNKTVEVLKGLSENKIDVLSYLLKGNKSIGIRMIHNTEEPPKIEWHQKKPLTLTVSFKQSFETIFNVYEKLYDLILSLIGKALSFPEAMMKLKDFTNNGLKDIFSKLKDGASKITLGLTEITNDILVIVVMLLFDHLSSKYFNVGFFESLIKMYDLIPEAFRPNINDNLKIAAVATVVSGMMSSTGWLISKIKQVMGTSGNKNEAHEDHHWFFSTILTILGPPKFGVLAATGYEISKQIKDYFNDYYFVRGAVEQELGPHGAGEYIYGATDPSKAIKMGLREGSYPVSADLPSFDSMRSAGYEVSVKKKYQMFFQRKILPIFELVGLEISEDKHEFIDGGIDAVFDFIEMWVGNMKTQSWELLTGRMSMLMFGFLTLHLIRNEMLWIFDSIKGDSDIAHLDPNERNIHNLCKEKTIELVGHDHDTCLINKINEGNFFRRFIPINYKITSEHTSTLEKITQDSDPSNTVDIKLKCLSFDVRMINFSKSDFTTTYNKDQANDLLEYANNREKFLEDLKNRSN